MVFVNTAILYLLRLVLHLSVTAQLQHIFPAGLQMLNICMQIIFHMILDVLQKDDRARFGWNQ